MPTSRSQPSTPAASINNGETKNMQKTRRSPSDYCRVATCEKLHIHDVTPKCLETFAPSSTCSSCQQCDQQHIGPNHSQLLLIKRLMKELPIIESMNNNPLPNTRSNTNTNNSNTNHNTLQSTAKQQQQSNTPIATTCLLMQWPLPEYRPQNSPVHLYRKIVI